MLDRQIYVTRRQTRSLEGMLRKDLEGWDFEDLSANRDSVHPRLFTLEPASKGWVDLTRDLQAATLAGIGFEELIRPAGPALCDYWSHLPRHRYLLACSISDREDVVRDHRSSESDHARLSDNLICDNAVDISGKCQCGDDAGNHAESVHVAFPSALSHKLCPNKDPITLSGAAVFGHHPSFSWTWGDTGPPTQQQSKQEIVVSYVSDKADKDSGVGESLGAPSSENHGSQAVRALFDQRHQHLPRVIGDNNQYALREMSQHMVISTSLPAGEYGTNAPASTVSDMMRSFTSIQFCLLIGIAGGAPSEDNDIRLGDVVVSLPSQTFPGVIQYDLGKENEGGEFEVTGVLQRPPRILTNAISKIRSDPDIGVDALNPHLTTIVNSLPRFSRLD